MSEPSKWNATKSEDEVLMDEWKPKFFGIDEDKETFSLDGEPFTPMSGEVHYFMIHPQTWGDTLSLIKEANMNCVTTAVEWALHEPFPGMYDFENELNLRDFLDLAFKKRLKVILKIGPQSSPDRDLGGLPHWLLTVNPEMKMRVQDESFMFFFGRWLEKLYGVVQPCLIGNGGPIIMIQIEDSYGSYPINDRNYLYWLRDVNKTFVGDRALLITSDYNDKHVIERGFIHGVYPTVNFGASSEMKVADQFEGLRTVQPKGPLMNMQYWVGSPTYWGDPDLCKLDAETLLNDIADFVTGGIGFNLHMFKGGTNFGLTAGAKRGKHCMTSYDCDAPISEAGDPTKKWALIKDLITGITGREYARQSEEEQRKTVEQILKNTKGPEPTAKGEYGIVPMVAAESFMNTLQTPWSGKRHESLFAKTMEEMCVRDGFLAYTVKLKQNINKDSILHGSVRDRAYIIINMKDPIGMIDNEKEFRIPKPLPEGTTMTFLVDNLGRDTYEPGKTVTKGLFNMYLNNEYMDHWVITTYSVRGPKEIEKLQNHLRKKIRKKIKPAAPAVDPNTEPYDMQVWVHGAKPNANTAIKTNLNSGKVDEITPPAFYFGTFTNVKDDGPDNSRAVVHKLDLEADVDYDYEADKLKDSFLNLTGWKKGVVYFNEWCLGRYWCVGPQQTLYVPGSYIRPNPGKNRITILELLGAPKDPRVTFVAGHVYGNIPEVDPVQEVQVKEMDHETNKEQVKPVEGSQQQVEKDPSSEAADGSQNQATMDPTKEAADDSKQVVMDPSAKAADDSQQQIATVPSKEAANLEQEVNSGSQSKLQETPLQAENIPKEASARELKDTPSQSQVVKPTSPTQPEDNPPEIEKETNE